MNVLKTDMIVMRKPRVKTPSEVMSVYATKDGLGLERHARVRYVNKIFDSVRTITIFWGFMN